MKNLRWAWAIGDGDVEIGVGFSVVSGCSSKFVDIMLLLGTLSFTIG